MTDKGFSIISPDFARFRAKAIGFGGDARQYWYNHSPVVSRKIDGPRSLWCSYEAKEKLKGEVVDFQPSRSLANRIQQWVRLYVPRRVLEQQLPSAP